MSDFHPERLEQAIGYRFRNRELLREALTHSSYANECKAKGAKGHLMCNERLEFLGDSILSLVVSQFLFLEYADLPEGILTKKRAALVQSQSLASYARAVKLGEYLFLGHGEEKNCGRERQSTLENAFEALLAAMYLDAGEEGLTVIRRFLTPIIRRELSRDVSVYVDSKTELQQLIQQAEGDFLEYEVIAESGPDHNKRFEVVAKMNSNIIGRGVGKSKREAEQNAAKEALRLFGEI